MSVIYTTGFKRRPASFKKIDENYLRMLFSQHGKDKLFSFSPSRGRGSHTYLQTAFPADLTTIDQIAYEYALKWYKQYNLPDE